jgi:hypothetical protein
MKHIYVIAFAMQAPVLLLAATLTSWPLLVVAISMVFLSVGALPAENGLLALYTPGKWRATAYGAKFVLAIGVSAMAVPLIALIHDRAGGFFWLFIILGAAAALVAGLGVLLPSERRHAVAAVAPAE